MAKRFSRPILALLVLGGSTLIPSFSRHASADTDACSGLYGIPFQANPYGPPSCQQGGNAWCFECVDTSLPGQALVLG